MIPWTMEKIFYIGQKDIFPKGYRKNINMKWLKANPQRRIEETIVERPLLHACCGKHTGFGTITLDSDREMKPMVLGDITFLPFRDNVFAAAYMDCPWTAAWKKNIAQAMKELLRVAPIVYVMSPWTYGASSWPSLTDGKCLSR